MQDKITIEKLEKYLSTTEKALKIAKRKVAKNKEKEAKEILEMAENYFKDAKYFQKQENYVNCFAAINYAHGWLDTGARLGIFKVKNTKLFVIK